MLEGHLLACNWLSVTNLLSIVDFQFSSVSVKGLSNVLGAGAVDAVVCEHHAYGGAGAAKLGEAVISACKQQVDFKFLYDLKLTIKVHCLQWACHSSNAAAGVHATPDSMSDMMQV